MMQMPLSIWGQSFVQSVTMPSWQFTTIEFARVIAQF